MRAANAVRFLVSSVAALTVFAGATGSWERDPQCVFPISQDISARVERWHRAVGEGDTAGLIASYSPNAILMGIGEQSIRLGRREIEAHYTTLLRDTVSVASVSRVIESSCSMALVTGLQRFTFSRGARIASAEVAYKMMYAYGEGDWMLIHHHLEPLSDFISSDTHPTVATASPLTTGTLPDVPKTKTLTLPPPAFQLSSAPPVLVSTHLPQVLSSTRPSEPVVLVEVEVPPLNIDTGRFPVLARTVEPAPQAVPVAVVIPALQIGIGAFPALSPLIEQPKASDIAVPRLGIDVGAFPMAAVATNTLPVPSLSPESARSPSAQSEPVALLPTRAPAVASFAQRAAAAARPTPPPPAAAKAVAPSKPVKVEPAAAKPTPAVAPTPVQSKSAYRAVRRWNESLPVFEDD